MNCQTETHLVSTAKIQFVLAEHVFASQGECECALFTYLCTAEIPIEHKRVFTKKKH